MDVVKGDVLSYNVYQNYIYMQYKLLKGGKKKKSLNLNFD